MNFHIVLITKPGHLDTGVGRYNQQLTSALERLGHQVTIIHPHIPFPVGLRRQLKKWLRIDLESFFYNYPVWAWYPPADLYHLTSQNLATLLLLRRPPGKTIVTVHDIIPWLTRKDPELRIYKTTMEAWIDRLALLGVARADAIITDSDYVFDTLQYNLELPQKEIRTVKLGVG